MANNYKKPLVLANEELAEGVYAASGGVANSDCWTAEARIHQRPETGRGDYRLQVDCKHLNINPDNHNSGAIVTIVFNQAVSLENAGGGGWTVVGAGNAIRVEFDVGTSNKNESKGWGDLIVTSDPGLEIVSVGIVCTGK